MTKAPFVLACCAMAVSGSEARAQRQTLDLLPTVGLLAPVRDLVVVTVQDGAVSRTFTLRQHAGFLAGGRLTAWWSRAVGWEAGFAYALSDVQLRENGTDLCQSPGRTCSANVWIASSKLLARWAPTDGRWTVFGSAGLTVVGHVGDFWQLADAATDLGTVLGVGGVIDLSRSLALRFDLDDHIYQFNAQFDDPELGTTAVVERWQHDVVLSATLVFRVFGM